MATDRLHIGDARIDGEVITISSRVSGWVTELPVMGADHALRPGMMVEVNIGLRDH